MAAHYNCVPISLPPNHIFFIPHPILLKVNEESIQLGFSQNLVEKIAELPCHLNFPILRAWNHTSGDGLNNIRLEILVGPDANDLHHCLLDVTPNTWATIMENFHQEEGEQL